MKLKENATLITRARPGDLPLALRRGGGEQHQAAVDVGRVALHADHRAREERRLGRLAEDDLRWASLQRCTQNLFCALRVKL